jgi:uncharacterized membrane protein YjjB (DUF3815 family)
MTIIAEVVLQLALGFVVTVGFAVLFNVPRYTLLRCGVVGAFGHLVRYVAITYGLSNEAATFIGALIVGVLGYLQARRYHLPRLAFTVVGIVSMIPGIPAYEVMFYFSQGDVVGGMASGVRAALQTGAIAAGLATARIITELEWIRGEPHG